MEGSGKRKKKSEGVVQSIFLHFVCLRPLIFLEALKLTRSNFHAPCINDGAKYVLSHKWLAVTGATGAVPNMEYFLEFQKSLGRP